jgi:hypothetical protein
VLIINQKTYKQRKVNTNSNLKMVLQKIQRRVGVNTHELNDFRYLLAISIHGQTKIVKLKIDSTYNIMKENT